MIPTTRLGKPIRQGTHDLCGIAAYVTAVRAFCGKQLIGFLHDIWEQEPVTSEPTDEATLRAFYQIYAKKLFDTFVGNETEAKMFHSLKHLHDSRAGLSFRNASFACSLDICSPAQIPLLENHIITPAAIACIAIGFDVGTDHFCHVVNVWHDSGTFCLRDSAKNDRDIENDGEATTLIGAVAKSPAFEQRNRHVFAGMAVTQK